MNISIQFFILITLAIAGPALLWSNPTGFFVYSLAIIILAVVVLIRPMPRLWLGSRIFALCWLFFAALPSLVISTSQLEKEREAYLALLREEDPIAYLSEIKSESPIIWYNELKLLDPEAFEVEKVRRAEARRLKRAQEAEAKAAARAHQCSGSYASQAYIYSQFFVEQELRSPTTASFPNIKRDGVTSTAIGNCRFRIRSYVDAQNAFGAEIRTRFAITIERLPEQESWKLISIDFSG